VADVLVVAAVELGHPVRLFVAVEADDPAVDRWRRDLHE
jgi:hypothetical protein